MADEIDWTKIAFAIEHYKINGWKYVEVPWRVPVRVLRMTFPQLEEDDREKFVGSAEQSFLHLTKQNILPSGKFVACTPCSRKEKVYDRLHKRTFLKVELYQNVDVNYNSLLSVLDEAFCTMTKLIDVEDVLSYVKTDIGWDLELNGIEVGSYGIRQVDGIEWIYGTGLAEPRFSIALASFDREDYREIEF